MGQQVVFTTTSGSQSVGPIASTKARVVTGTNPTFFNVGNAAVAAAPGNCEIIAANSTRYINMQGLNNYIAFYGNVGQTTVTVEQIGTVNPSGFVANTGIMRTA